MYMGRLPVDISVASLYNMKSKLKSYFKMRMPV